MFDVLIFFAVIYFVGSAIMKRMVAAQKKSGAPTQRSGRPIPPGAPPWMRTNAPPQKPASERTPSASAPEVQPDSAPKRSTFETLYESIRDQLEPSALEDETLPPSPIPQPEATDQPSGSMKAYKTKEGYADPQDYEGSADIPESHWAPSPTPENTAAAQPATLSGLGIRLNADTLVQGIIFSEILNRNHRGRGMIR